MFLFDFPAFKSPGGAIVKSFLFIGHVLVAFIVSAIAALSSPANAAVRKFGPFQVDDIHPMAIVLDGEIDIDTALNFHRAIQADPKANILVLNSAGGLVQIALLIAEDVYERKLSTYIPSDKGCYSACSFIFLAGAERQVDGKLGVHQISQVEPDKANGLVSAQSSISDILDVLTRFKTPIGVMTVMFKTPPDQIHVFTPAEIAEYGINRKADDEAPVAATAAPPQNSPALSNGAPPDASTSALSSLQEENTPNIGRNALSKLSALQQYAQRPTRMAVYTGLDFFGDDLSSERLPDAAACARACLSTGGKCQAFTFNANPNLSRGPNCFLKGDRGRKTAMPSPSLVNCLPAPTQIPRRLRWAS